MGAVGSGAHKITEGRVRMGEVISLAERRRSAPPVEEPGTQARAIFFFDLSCPFTYLAVERVELLLPGVRWAPALDARAHRDPANLQTLRTRAEQRARAMHLPLVWPPGWPRPARRALRAAQYAAECGRAGEFALAAARLSFCGGYDVDEVTVLCEAAAAAGISVGGVVRAAEDVTRDAALRAVGSRLAQAGADRLPAVRVDHRLYCGEEHLGLASRALRHPASPTGAGAG